MLLPRAPQRILMSGLQRWIIYSLTTALWLSGCLWLYLDQWARHRDAFGGERSPWQSTMLTTHSVLAIAAMYLLGWVTARHIAYWWSLDRRRGSGSLLSGVFGLLTISGFALFFLSDDRWQRYTAIAHDVLGVAVAILLIQHWFLFRRASPSPPSR
jgi:hypothetical protein